MMEFLRGDADVLVSTTIIESGLDILQANTLVVERADMLRPAQLYQIRGRVGRSDVPAHAYLLYPTRPSWRSARARLSTLADHTELGSGFAIAMRISRFAARASCLAGSSPAMSQPSASSCTSTRAERVVEELAGGKRIVPGRCASTHGSTRTCRRTTSRRRR